MPKRPEPPKGLQGPGRGLWERMHATLADDLRFSAKELELLRRACSLADREAALAGLIEQDGMMTKGSTGQMVLHPAVAELRHVESALTSLLTRISTEDSEGKPLTMKQQRARTAADARWGAHRATEERRMRVVNGG